MKINPGRLDYNRNRVALVGLDWNGGGAHAIVAARFTDDSRAVVFLDPATGDIAERANDGNYDDGYGSWGAITDIYYF